MKEGGLKQLDIGKLNRRIVKITSMEEALKDVSPVEWPESVIEGKNQVIVNNANVEGDACVKLEISYS